MLGDNIKTFRKKKGFSQETLAQELFVVRQTVSKWEKGQSVPDAEMIEKLAEVLDVSVNDLLGKEIKKKENEEQQDNEIAKQLAILNEQLAGTNRRRKKLLKIVLTFIIAAMVLSLAAAVISSALIRNVTYTGVTVTETIYCTIDGNDYVWEVTYDKDGNLIKATGDAWIRDNIIDPQKFNSAEEQLKEIERYVEEHNGSYRYD